MYIIHVCIYIVRISVVLEEQIHKVYLTYSGDLYIYIIIYTDTSHVVDHIIQ